MTAIDLRHLFTRYPEERALSLEAETVNTTIIHGDNVAVLSDLRADLQGEVSCVYMDPPYNNMESYTHYDDKQNFSEWLDSVKRVASACFYLLAEGGSMWISIDDRQMHYLKVALDGEFGRDSFVSTIVWNHRTTRENRTAFSPNHEYILVYAKIPLVFKKRRNRLPLDEVALERYKNFDNDPRGPWQSVSANVQAGHAVPSQFYEIKTPSGRVVSPPKGRCWAFNQERMNKEITENNIWFGKNGNGVPRIKKFLKPSRSGLTPNTLWAADEVGTTLSAKKHLLSIFSDTDVFDTPKPEELIKRIIEIATDPGDLVLDPYLGSGTTCSTAHKMNRRSIGIERGAHAVSHCAERLRLVCAGEQGGVSKTVSWKGGGGFSFFKG